MSARTLRLARYLVRTADVQSRIDGIIRNNPEADRKLLDDIASIDPSGEQGLYINWVFKNINLKDRSKRINWTTVNGEDKERTRQALEFFHSLKPSEREFNGISQDINQLDLRALEAFKRQVHGHPDLPSFSGESLPEGSSLFAHEGEFEVVKVGGPGVDSKVAIEAACTLGKGTEWCTRDVESAKSYLKRGPLFVIYKNDKPYAQFHRDKDNNSQLMDIVDRDISMSQDPELYYLLDELKLMPKAMFEFESLLFDREGRIYSRSSVKGTPEQEAEIAKSPQYAFAYASQILRDKPFPLGEPAIAKVPGLAYEYARDILQERFPLGEPAIAKDPGFAYNYARQVLDGKRFLQGEPVIAKSSSNAIWYAQHVLHGRFPEAEPAIAMDGMHSYLYAIDALGGRRFPPGEPSIAKDPVYSIRYAQHVLKDPEPTSWGLRYLDQDYLWKGGGVNV